MLTRTSFLVIPRGHRAVRGYECTAAASKTAAFAYSTMLPRCQMLVVAMFGRCSWIVSVWSRDQRLMLDAASAGAVGGTIGGAVRAREGLV